MEHAAVFTQAPVSACDELLVCRKIVTNGVVIASLHPVHGPLYWTHRDNSGTSAEDSYGLTDSPCLATVFTSGKYPECLSFDGAWGCVMDALSHPVLDTTGQDGEEWPSSIAYRPDLETLTNKAKCSPTEMYRWAATTTWVEYPAPARAYFLSDFNGNLGYRAQWSTAVADAVRFGTNAATSDDLADILARQMGDLVPISRADVFLRPAVKASGINHALEADVAFTLFRLRLNGIGNRPRELSFKDEALIHAASAGYERVMHFGDAGEVSPHLAAFPMLFNAFAMAASLARHERNLLALYEGAEMRALAQRMLDAQGDWSPAAQKLLPDNRALCAYDDGAWIVDTLYDMNCDMRSYIKMVCVLPVR